MPCRYDLKKRYDLPLFRQASLIAQVGGYISMNQAILVVIISVLNVSSGSGQGFGLLGNPGGTSLSIYKNLLFLTVKHSFYLLDLV